MKMIFLLLLSSLSLTAFAWVVDVYTTENVGINGTRYAKENHVLNFNLIDSKDNFEDLLNKRIGKLPANEIEARAQLKNFAVNNQELIRSIARSWRVNFNFQSLGLNKSDLPVAVINGRVFKQVTNLDVLLRRLDKHEGN